MPSTITNGLCTLADLKAALRMDAGDFADDDRLNLAVDAASRMLERVSGRRFWADTTPSQRFFVASSPFLCEVDDFWTAQTTIASASNGMSLPQATINVVSTAGFTTSGGLVLATSPPQEIGYTGITGTTFTGCTGGTGTLLNGMGVSDIPILQTDPYGDGSFQLTWNAVPPNPRDFQMEPLNGLLEGHPWPYTKLRAVRSLTFPVFGGIAYPLPYVQALVRLTAKWGWPAVPSDVRKACIAQAMALFKADDVPFGATPFAESGIVRLHAALHPTAAALIEQYSEHTVLVM